MKRVLICNIVPSTLINDLKAPQSANNFCFDLINNSCFDFGLSIVPLNYYDKRIKNETNMYYYSGLSKGKFLDMLQIIYYNIICSIKIRKAENIWFYNIVKSNIISYIILRYFLKRNVYVILLDHTPTRSIFNVQYYVPHLLKNSSGLISLSNRTKLKNTNQNIKYVAGIIPKAKALRNKVPNRNKKRFLFSGVLDNHTGFDLAIEVFTLLPDYELYVAGLGNHKYTNLKYPDNIKFLGYLSYEKYLKLYDVVDACLSFRNPNYNENENNFPSKILEYFSYNKIVLSTIYYPELIGFNYLKCEYNIDSIITYIKYINNLSEKELLLFTNNSDMLVKSFSEQTWKDTMHEVETNIKK